MSFKRDGDDFNLLNNLKRRRVGDLISSHIPKDEALLLKNGRYSCSICYHRPIFDTMEMLSIHRKGKKHISSLSRHLQNKQEIKDLILQRQQERSPKTDAEEVLKLPVNNDKTNGLGTSYHPLLKAKRYSSCLRKASKKSSTKFDRKQTISLPTSEKEQALPAQNEQKKSATFVIRSYLKSIRRKKDFGQFVKQSRQLKAESSPSNCCASGSALASAETCNLQGKLPEHADKSKLGISYVENRKRTEYYIGLREKGWKKDLKGNWIRDEDAEFDSDEELPAEYLTTALS